MSAVPTHPTVTTASRVRAESADRRAGGRSEGVQGAQSLRRALGLLRYVAQAGEAGMRLADLVRSTGLDRATAYRMLSCLVEEEFLDRDDDLRYRLGPLAVLLGSTLPAPTPLLQRFVPVMKRVARISNESVFLVLRRGDHAHCTHREHGPSGERVLAGRVGKERLLGTSTGGLAILGLLEPAAVQALYRRHESEYADLGIDERELLERAASTRRTGYAVSVDSLEPGVSGVGVAFHLSRQGMAALSINAWSAQFGVERQCQARELLMQELNSLGLH
ncbi:IclR family transcriptional regulator [Caldimonas thermodepolymerans]|uniref:IclR family transcriptional regulator n=1 Tax=Caldimonas thermodepolymerans TaxID=215580 RepID=UPI00223595FF|nr:IclR family transcriptional regulator [Caldimonas thermodepolymerans]UZG44391.1 IclR family transcriptional regulator [Caldimonas thermodepolymerans]